MAKLVSKVYGDALFEAAQETKCLDETFEQVLALQEILKEHEDLIQDRSRLRTGSRRRSRSSTAFSKEECRMI